MSFTSTRSTYPLWHGNVPMGRFIEERLASEKLLVEGDGIRVRDQGGSWFIDARSSLWNVGLGYSAGAVKRAIAEQLERLPFATLLSYERPAKVTIEYAQALAGRFPERLRTVRLGNSGSQMTEAAVLLSRFVRHVEGAPDRMAVIAFDGSFHGLGAAATELSGIVTAHGCGPLLPDIHHVSPHGSWTAAVAQQIERLGEEAVSAVIIEPQMGSAGIVPGGDDLRRLAQLCKDRRVHLIADEVSTGFGRTGTLSRTVELGIDPDMLVLGKNMTSGYVPIGALLVDDVLADPCFDPASGASFPHGTTTDGHPLAAAAGLAVLQVYDERDVLGNVRRSGAVLREELERLAQGRGDVAGVGLMLRLALNEHDGTPWSLDRLEALRLACERHGLLLSKGMGCVWLVPPLVITAEECREVAERLRRALEES